MLAASPVISAQVLNGFASIGRKTLAMSWPEIREAVGSILILASAVVALDDDLTIAALGLAFKPDVDDLRESPARKVVGDLADEFPDASILVVEPHIRELPKELANRRNVELGPLSAAAKADVVVLLVDHSVFKSADQLALGLADKAVIDTRGVWR